MCIQVYVFVNLINSSLIQAAGTTTSEDLQPSHHPSNPSPNAPPHTQEHATSFGQIPACNACANLCMCCIGMHWFCANICHACVKLCLLCKHMQCLCKLMICVYKFMYLLISSIPRSSRRPEQQPPKISSRPTTPPTHLPTHPRTPRNTLRRSGKSPHVMHVQIYVCVA
jgi:hypothetical protein